MSPSGTAIWHQSIQVGSLHSIYSTLKLKRTVAGRAFFIAWALFGIGVMTILLSVLKEVWSTRYKTSMSQSKMRQTMNRYTVANGKHNRIIMPRNRHSPHPGLTQEQRNDALTPMFTSALTVEPVEASDLGKKLTEAARSFTEHAKYFMLSRKGDVPDQLQSLLELAEDEAALARIRMEAHGAETEVRGDAEHFLFLISYNKALETLVDTCEHATSVLSQREAELGQMRDLNSELRDEIHKVRKGNTLPIPMNETYETNKLERVLTSGSLLGGPQTSPNKGDTGPIRMGRGLFHRRPTKGKADLHLEDFNTPETSMGPDLESGAPSPRVELADSINVTEDPTADHIDTHTLDDEDNVEEVRKEVEENRDELQRRVSSYLASINTSDTLPSPVTPSTAFDTLSPMTPVTPALSSDFITPVTPSAPFERNMPRTLTFQDEPKNVK